MNQDKRQLSNSHVTDPVSRSDRAEINAFLSQVRAITPAVGSGRIILALDATMSRQPTWDLACRLQAQMFDAVARAGDLKVQLVYFRGIDECRASRFVGDGSTLKNLMTKIVCRGGPTQIGKVFTQALRETEREKVNAVVFIGDSMEEGIDLLAKKAGELGVRGVPIFLFQEGREPGVEIAFREFARLSKGAWFRFDANAADTLAKLLSAIAVFATGGVKALEARGRPEDRLLISHLKSPDGGG